MIGSAENTPLFICKNNFYFISGLGNAIYNGNKINMINTILSSLKSFRFGTLFGISPIKTLNIWKL